jgi:sugar lactone lactonase YvrE
MDDRPTVWTTARFELGESARWVGGRLVFVDILSGRLLEADGRGSGAVRELARLDVPLGAVAPVAGTGDEWIVAAGTGIALFRGGVRLEWLARPEDANPARARMNDGACDLAGRFWAGSMAYDSTPGAGSLYRTDADGTVTRVVDGITVANGPAFDHDGETLYYADTAIGVIYRCRIEPAGGKLLAHEPFVRLPTGEGSPDGMTVDDQHHLWVAVWDGSAVHRYAPDGSLRQVVRLPATRPTSVCLGGPAGDRLFVTTASYGLDPTHAPDGAVLALDVTTTAPPARPYRPAPGTGGPGRRRTEVRPRE